MIRLYVNNYSQDELYQLYNALSLVRTVVEDVTTNPVKDLDEALVYLSGYMYAKGDNAK